MLRPGERIDSTELIERLVLNGYRREYQVEHRGELAVRGSIIDVFPSTADAPVRIDLWGDEVERLCEFSVGDQRATVDVEDVQIFGARELLPGPEVRERAERLLSTQPWGREQWQRLADGEVFEGMEAWLAWLADREHVLFDLVPDDAQILLVDPRRLRDRAGDIAAEEADLGASLSRTWGLVADEGAESVELPRLHVDFDRLLRHTDAPVWSVANVPDSPDSPAVVALAWPPAIGEAQALLTQLRQVVNDGYSVVVCADSAGSAGRIDALLNQNGFSFPVLPDGAAPTATELRVAGGRILVAPLDRGVILPGARLALLAEADLTGRRRMHRPPRAAKRDAQRFFEDLKVGDHVVHQVHGVARFEGMVTRAMGGVERDYLLLEYRGGDKLYVPSDQIDTIRLYSGGETPEAQQDGRCGLQPHQGEGPLGGGRDRPGAGRALPATPRDTGPRVRPGHSVAAGDGALLPVPGDTRPAVGDRGGQGRHGVRGPDGPTGVRRRRLRQDRGGAAGGVQGRPGRAAGGGAGAHDAAGPAALPDLLGALRRLPGQGRGPVAVPDHRAGALGGRAGRPAARSTSSSAPTGCCRATSPSRTWACSWSTRSSASACRTRSRSSSSAPRSTC